MHRAFIITLAIMLLAIGIYLFIISFLLLFVYILLAMISMILQSILPFIFLFLEYFHQYNKNNWSLEINKQGCLKEVLINSCITLFIFIIFLMK